MIIMLVIMAFLGLLVAFAATVKVNAPVLLLIIVTITTGFMLGYLQGWAKYGQ